MGNNGTELEAVQIAREVGHLCQVQKRSGWIREGVSELFLRSTAMNVKARRQLTR